jgi:hypothetical protein
MRPDPFVHSRRSLAAEGRQESTAPTSRTTCNGSRLYTGLHFRPAQLQPTSRAANVWKGGRLQIDLMGPPKAYGECQIPAYCYHEKSMRCNRKACAGVVGIS